MRIYYEFWIDKKREFWLADTLIRSYNCKIKIY